MDSGNKLLRIVIGVGVALIQLVMTQVLTLLVSFLIPDMEAFQQASSALFALIVGLTFSAGVFLTGWLAIKLRWLKVKPVFAARLVVTLIGAYVPLLIALVLYPALEAGNPFFSISILGSILGFYIPGWISKE